MSGMGLGYIPEEEVSNSLVSKSSLEQEPSQEAIVIQLKLEGLYTVRERRSFTVV